MSNSVLYHVKGIHCSSCEIIIERKLSEQKNISKVKVSNGDNSVEIFYKDKKPSIAELNKLFKKEGYIFDNQEQKAEFDVSELMMGFIIAGLIFVAFLLLGKSGITSAASVNQGSGLAAFFILGILAGLSTCSALVGGIILSMGDQWQKFYSKSSSTIDRMRPHITFNIGRILSYMVVGLIVGAIGSVLQLSLTFSSILSIAISILMLILGLQMLGVKAASRVKIAMPKSVSNFVSDEKNFNGRLMPAMMGAGTVLLPCGFTITTISMAALSGDPIRGGLMMLAFALGTLPSLLTIGFTSVMSVKKSNFNSLLSVTMGALVVFFAIYNINSAMNALALPSLSDFRVFGNSSVLASTEDQVQVIKMEASARGYSPNYFKVKVGVPVRWEIEDVGTSGCTNAVIAQSFFDGEIPLTPGKTSIKEFTPEKVGRYKFSCWMGMVTGTIEVVGADEDLGAVEDSQVIIGSPKDSQKTIEAETEAAGCGGECSGGCGGSCGSPSCGYR